MRNSTLNQFVVSLTGYAQAAASVGVSQPAGRPAVGPPPQLLASGTWRLPPATADELAVAQHTAYLCRMDLNGVVPHPVAKNARAAWEALRRAVPGLPVPVATATRGESISYYWDKGRHHLEAEFMADGTFEWFYRDRETEQYEGDTSGTPHAPPRDFLAKLRLAFGPTATA